MIPDRVVSGMRPTGPARVRRTDPRKLARQTMRGVREVMGLSYG
jgi:hypothetical protein